MIVLDYRDKRPIYEQVVEKLEHLIICGGMEANSKLPSVRTLAMELSVNPNTIQRAYAQLEQDGYIYTIIGRGNYVTDKCEWQKGHFETLKRDFRALLTQALDAGFPRQELLAMIDTVYQTSQENAPSPDASKSAPSESHLQIFDSLCDPPTSSSMIFEKDKEEPTHD